MPAGRKKTQAIIDLESIFENNQEKIFDDDGNVKVPKSEIWKELCEISGKNVNKENAKSVYSAAIKWKQKLEKEKDKENKTENVEDDHDFFIETSFESSESSDSDSSVEDKRSKSNVKRIKIEISSKVWRTIEPTAITHARNRKNSHKSGVRTYLALEPELWTDVFADKIAKITDIPCKWVFKRNKCYLTGKVYVKIHARCKICSAVLVATLKNKPDNNEPVIFYGKIDGINSQRHKEESKNVRLTSKISQNIVSQNKTATSIRRGMLVEKAEMFIEPTARIPSANAIRCSKYRQRQKEKLSDDPFESLKYLQMSNMYANCIHRLGWNAFYVIYSSPEQIKLYQEYKKRNKLTKISCDATGGVVHKLRMCILYNIIFFIYE